MLDFWFEVSDPLPHKRDAGVFSLADYRLTDGENEIDVPVIVLGARLGRPGARYEVGWRQAIDMEHKTR